MLKKKGCTVLFTMVTILAAHAQMNNQLTDIEKQAGWKLLFDGKSSTGWHTYNKKSFGPAWKIVDGSLFCDTAFHIPKGE